MSAFKIPQLRMRCLRCREQVEADKSNCYCREIERRRAYDRVREYRGLVALYRPKSLR
jgi:hypothetical protein